ncbi:MAG: hypothetical protein KF784_04945 [Fimbriimonadaceae bacterium]|nr:hypothetical protein [Fimbriimonadaceae bacterium]
MDEEYLLGPFYDIDGTEFLPTGFDETFEPLELAMGSYVVTSNDPALTSKSIKVTNRDLTAYIQADWERVFGPEPTKGFVMAYRSGTYAAGRIAEEILVRKFFETSTLFGEHVQNVQPAMDVPSDLFQRVSAGVRSDDAVLITTEHEIVLVESKASFSGFSYLSRSVPKAIAQLSASLQVNFNALGGVVLLTNLQNRHCVVGTFPRDDFVNRQTHVAEQLRGLIQSGMKQ